MSTTSASVRRVVSLVATSCALALCLALSGVSARAAGSLSISGASSYFSCAGGSQDATDATGDTVDVLTVSGAQDDTVYFRVTKGDATVADHLAYTLGEAAQTGQADFAGVASLTFAGGFDTGATYAVSVYADREEAGDPLYTGTLQAVFAQVEGLGQPVAIGTYTSAEGEEPTFVAPQTITLGGVSYQLASADPVSTEPLAYAYAPAGDATTYTATVTYADEDGATIATDTYQDIPLAETRRVDVRQYVSSEDGSYYRSLDWSPTITFSAAGTRSVVVSCRQVDQSYASQQGFHTTTVTYVDESGAQVFTDRVTVATTVYYGVPSSFYVPADDDSLVTGYDLASDGQDPRLQGGTLTLSPSDTDKDTDAVTVRYASNVSDPIQWAVRCVYRDPKTGRDVVLNGDEAPIQVERTAGNTKEYTARASITKDGTTYVPADGAKTYTYTYGSGAMPQTTIYYVPEGEKPAIADYQVTINYADYATKRVITSKQVTVSLSHGDYALESDEQFSLDGVTYVRLAGQEQPLRHSFYSGPATYTIWYRDINNTAIRGSRVTRVSVVYLPGGTTGTGTDAGAGAGTTVGATAGGAGTATGSATTGIPTTDAGLSAVGDGTTSTLVGGDGTDLGTERIEDEETPLASGATDAPSQGMGLAQGVGIGAAVAAACLLVLFLVRRRRNQDEQNQTAGTDAEGR